VSGKEKRAQILVGKWNKEKKKEKEEKIRESAVTTGQGIRVSRTDTNY